MRDSLIAGNWKMNKTNVDGVALVRDILAELRSTPAHDSVGIAVCPPFPALVAVHEVLRGTTIRLGAQNVHYENDGAYTGEVSASMLKAAGCTYVIVGHSERRHSFNESDAIVNRKARKVLSEGLIPIICLGETLDQRESGATREVVGDQLTRSLEAFEAEMLLSSVIAYEPVWAIGTGKNATPAQAQDVHAFLRSRLAERFGDGAASAVQILYGGSMKPDNAREILLEPDVDGGLIGGASLTAEHFVALVRIASAIIQERSA